MTIANKFMVLFFLLCAFTQANAQSFTSWITGDTADVQVSSLLSGVVLAGGGGDNDQAMSWMLERANGGDILVLRASGSDGYNNYFYSSLGVDVHSVETIRFDGPEAASDPYVLRRIEEAEVLFLAGGDQYDYYTYWKDKAVETAIQYLIDEKGITLGGTSAGMAILGQAYYAPSSLGVITSEALGNPFHPYMDVIGYDDFLQVPYLDKTITDTHFDQRNRSGRFVSFLARLSVDQGFRPKGIASNEYTAVCVDENGIARCFGEYPDFEEDLVYFAQANCVAPFEPEDCSDGNVLHWVRNQEALKVCRIPATENGNNTFDLNDWMTQSGGEWLNWYVENGELKESSASGIPDCSTWTGIPELSENPIQLYPNPVNDQISLEGQEPGSVYQIIDLNGRTVQSGTLIDGQINVADLISGYYNIRVIGLKNINQESFIKQ